MAPNDRRMYICTLLIGQWVEVQVGVWVVRGRERDVCERACKYTCVRACLSAAHCMHQHAWTVCLRQWQ